MTPSPIIRDAVASDVPQLTALYNYYIIHTCHTFEVDAIAPEVMEERRQAKQRDYGFLVLCDHQKSMMGFAYYGRFRERAAYNHMVESSIYLDHNLLGQGFGVLLYQALLKHAHDKGYSEVVAVIATPNPASEALHRRLGFTYCGCILRSGRKFSRCIDTVYYQRSVRPVAHSPLGS